MNPDPPSQEQYRDEYKLVFEGYKFFVGIRFITAAFAMSIQSALLGIYDQATRRGYATSYTIFGLAILFLAALLIIEWRTINLFKGLLQRGTELEFQLGSPHGFFHRINEISSHGRFRFIPTHTKGIALVYAGMFVLWILLLVATVTKKPEPEPERKVTYVNATQSQG